MRLSGLSAVLAASVVSASCQTQPAHPVPAAQSAPAPPAANSPFIPSSSIRELMQSMVAPSAQGLWDSVGRVSDAKGTRDIAPKTDDEWAAVRRHAVSLMESTNLLMMSGRHVARAGDQTNKAEDADPGAELPPATIEKRINQEWAVWIGMAQALHTSAASMLDAVDKKDVARLESTGSDLDGVCETCHLTFWYPPRAAR